MYCLGKAYVFIKKPIRHYFHLLTETLVAVLAVASTGSGSSAKLQRRCNCLHTTTQSCSHCSLKIWLSAEAAGVIWGLKPAVDGNNMRGREERVRAEGNVREGRWEANFKFSSCERKKNFCLQFWWMGGCMDGWYIYSDAKRRTAIVFIGKWGTKRTLNISVLMHGCKMTQQTWISSHSAFVKTAFIEIFAIFFTLKFFS